MRAKLTGLPALADDSGLCVRALRGAPGVYSARYAQLAGGEKSDAANNARLVDATAGRRPTAAPIIYCVLVLVRHADDPEPSMAEGRWHGEILDVPRGAHGFGYDPHFFLPALNATAAELDPAVKNAAQPSRDRIAATARASDGGSVIPIQPAGQSGAGVIKAFTAPGRIHLTSLPPLALYVHFPWCVRKCPYCDFNSHEWKGERSPKNEYLDALRTDLELALPLVWGRQVHTVFIGGGTPSLLSAAGLDRLLSDVRALLPLDADAEITLEANPGTFEADKFAQFRASGVNRLSVGIQSFNEAHLTALGRIHDSAQARHAVEVAADISTTSISI